MHVWSLELFCLFTYLYKNMFYYNKLCCYYWLVYSLVLKTHILTLIFSLYSPLLCQLKALLQCLVWYVTKRKKKERKKMGGGVAERRRCCMLILHSRSNVLIWLKLRTGSKHTPLILWELLSEVFPHTNSQSYKYWEEG